MHASKFGLIAVLSCVSVIDAIPVGDRAPAEASVRRQYASQGLGVTGIGGTISDIDRVLGTSIDGLSEGRTVTGSPRPGGLQGGLGTDIGSLLDNTHGTSLGLLEESLGRGPARRQNDLGWNGISTVDKHSSASDPKRMTENAKKMADKAKKMMGGSKS